MTTVIMLNIVPISAFQKSISINIRRVLIGLSVKLFERESTLFLPFLILRSRSYQLCFHQKTHRTQKMSATCDQIVLIKFLSYKITWSWRNHCVECSGFSLACINLLVVAINNIFASKISLCNYTIVFSLFYQTESIPSDHV